MKKLLKLPAIIAVVIACTAFTGVLLWSVYLSGKFVVNLFTSSDKPVEQTSAQEAPTTPVVEEKPVEPTLDPKEILRLVNEERAKVGVKPLVMDERLNQSAKFKTDEIARTKNYSHYSPDGNLTAYNIPEYMTECKWFSENLSDAPDNPVGSDWPVKGWMLSTKHREALLDPRYEYTGIAITDGYIAQHFCDVDK